MVHVFCLAKDVRCRSQRAIASLRLPLTPSAVTKAREANIRLLTRPQYPICLVEVLQGKDMDGSHEHPLSMPAYSYLAIAAKGEQITQTSGWKKRAESDRQAARHNFKRGCWRRYKREPESQNATFAAVAAAVKRDTWAILGIEIVGAPASVRSPHEVARCDCFKRHLASCKVAASKKKESATIDKVVFLSSRWLYRLQSNPMRLDRRRAASESRYRAGTWACERSLRCCSPFRSLHPQRK